MYLCCMLGVILPGANQMSSTESFVPEGVLFGLWAWLPLPYVGFITRRSMSGNYYFAFPGKMSPCPCAFPDLTSRISSPQGQQLPASVSDHPRSLGAGPDPGRLRRANRQGQTGSLDPKLEPLHPHPAPPGDTGAGGPPGLQGGQQQVGSQQKWMSVHPGINPECEVLPT